MSTEEKNRAPLDDTAPRPGRESKKRSTKTSLRDVEASWRRWHGLPENTPVDVGDLLTTLRILVYEAGRALGDGPDVFQRVTQHLVAFRVRADTTKPANQLRGDVTVGEGTVDRGPADLASPPATLRADGLRESALPPSSPEDAPAIAPKPHTARRPDEAVVGTLRNELKRLLDAERRAFLERLAVVEAAAELAVHESRATRVTASDLRSQFEEVGARLAVLGERVTDLGERDKTARAQLLGGLQQASVESSGVARIVGELGRKLDGRIDLSDAKQLLQLRQEVDRFVRSEQIRSISQAIVPAVDALRDALRGGDGVAAMRAVEALTRRCEQAGLVMDQRQLF